MFNDKIHLWNFYYVKKMCVCVCMSYGIHTMDFAQYTPRIVWNGVLLLGNVGSMRIFEIG